MQNEKAKVRLFLFLAIVMFAPLLQQCFNVIESGPLHGLAASTPDVSFSLEKWWDGSYQKQKNSYLNDSTGFRPDFVRIGSQIDFSLFGKLHANHVLLGKDNNLFEETYIDEYTGRNKTAYAVQQQDIYELKRIQDTLEHLGKTLVLIDAASKAYFMPDKIPDNGRYNHRFGPSDYQTHIHICDSIGVHHIDMNKWFMAMKDTSRNKLFTKQGTHWSTYGALLVADSLIRYIEQARKIQLPELHITAMKYDTIPRNSDADIAKAINLISPLKNELLSYPDYIYKKDSTTAMPKMVFIGDSFIWPLMHINLPENISKDWEFWYYFNEVYKQKADSLQHIITYNWPKAIAEADCIVIVYTTINLRDLGSDFGFIKKCSAHYYPELNTARAK